MESTAIAIRPQHHELDRLGFEPRDTAEAFQLATWVVSSGFYAQLKTPEAAMMVIMQGREVGMTALASLNGIDIIYNRTALRAVTQLALIRAHPITLYYRILEETDTRATVEWLRKDERTGIVCRELSIDKRHPWHDVLDQEDSDPGIRLLAKLKSCPACNATRAQFSRKNAEDAGYFEATKDGKFRDGWKRQVGVMILWRAISKSARQGFSDVLAGMANTEELRDELEAPAPTLRVDGEVPTTAEGVVSAALVASGIDVVKKARATAPKDDAAPKPKTRAKLDSEPRANSPEDVSFKKPDPPPPPKDAPEANMTPAAIAVRKEVIALQHHFLKHIDLDRAKAAWNHESGPGTVSGVTDEAKLKEKLELAEGLIKRFEVCTKLNAIRDQWSEVTGEKPVFIERPEICTLKALEDMLTADTRKLEIAKAKRDKEGGLPLGGKAEEPPPPDDADEPGSRG